MLLTRTAKPTRTVDLKPAIEKLVSEFPHVQRVYIFGSRRFETGSVRSDIDLLLITQNDEIDYHLPARIREVEAYIDAFQVIGGKAVSFANHSQITSTGRDGLIKLLDAVCLWSRENGWDEDPRFTKLEVLSGQVPEYTVARMEPGTIDPAKSIAQLVIITALQKEYTAVCKRLAHMPDTVKSLLDEGELFEHRYPDGDARKIVVLRATRMGPVAAALQTILAIRQWSPKLVVLVGITAGIASEGVQLGDIILPDRLVEYDAIKVKDDSARFHGLIPAPSAAHSRQVEQWPGLSDWLKQRGCVLPDPRDAIALRTDAVASGMKVVGSEAFLEEIAKYSRKICALEMEAIGVAEACAVLPSPTPYLVVKAVTDLASEKKDDRCHPIASEAVADLVALLIDDRRLV
jgi:nucleoside phosphorylase